MTTRITSMVGMRILEVFSIPPRTPATTMARASRAKTAVCRITSPALPAKR